MQNRKKSTKNETDAQAIEKWNSLKESVETARRELDRLSGRLESATEDLEKCGCSDLQEASEMVKEKKNMIKDLGKEFAEKVEAAHKELKKIEEEEDE